MTTCGYVCPKCEGSGVDKETLEVCDWCNITSKIKYDDNTMTISDEEWMEQVHNQNCCSDVAPIDNQINRH